jgi:hypothetical protein
MHLLKMNIKPLIKLPNLLSSIHEEPKSPLIKAVVEAETDAWSVSAEKQIPAGASTVRLAIGRIINEIIQNPVEVHRPAPIPSLYRRTSYRPIKETRQLRLRSNRLLL